ncbi:MAG: ATP-binding protein, partial [Proteobacteria bacterium]|nr:ATP-binding protein [Pseudomonadota bacterium]
LDVEEPNLHLFLHPDLRASEVVYMPIPKVDEERCTSCRKCVDICQFKAITIWSTTVMVFPEMCHGCGGCKAVCPEGAISDDRRELGELVQGFTGTTPYLMGRLRIGEAMSPPLMRAVKKQMTVQAAAGARDVLIDAPPGVSCPAVCAVIDSDYLILVTEPTPFGFHDFRLAVEAFAPFDIPLGVVINRAGHGDQAVYDYCREKGLHILAEIPYDRAIAEAYANGRLAAGVSAEYRRLFEGIRDSVRSAFKEAAHA